MAGLGFALGLLVLALSSPAALAARVSSGVTVANGDLTDSQLCDTCLVAMRLMNDMLCDEGAVDFIVDLAVKQLCPATPDEEECDQLAQALLPVAVEWLRASATPASLCAAAGVCGASLMGDFGWDVPAKTLSDPGLTCPLCYHLVDSIAAAGPGAAGSDARAAALSAALKACDQLPGGMPAYCKREVEKRGLLFHWAMSAAAAFQAAEAARGDHYSEPGEVAPPLTCELMGMCTIGLGRFAPPALPRALVAAFAGAMRGSLGAVGGRLMAAASLPALKDNRCDVCKLMVLEVATLLANPQFQQTAVQYAEATCDAVSPPGFADTCRTYVDTYAPVVFALVQQYVNPDDVCVRVRMCARPEGWRELVLGEGKDANMVDGAVLP
ncbi:hypothetical protein HYH03_005623 [Edaphochlamys debaryana]|uniref:Saposin B-type domain-containing protein n=1 Tax=Edaphochlamys debaryana TaxID=47281 RepID=A0A835Y5I7_9CHLO|nr:hypothetical protein HYH03_005623 [Edaphochlamys debaryana]|eukprot:KAG2496396.1 hypothetical protein HYH03_005623 [Edaphochlamys debaryana]